MKDVKEDARMFLMIGRQAVGEVVRRGYSISERFMASVFTAHRDAPTFRVIHTPSMDSYPLAHGHNGLTTIQLTRVTQLGVPDPLELLLDEQDRFIPFDPCEFDLVYLRAIDPEAMRIGRVPAILGLLPAIATKFVAREDHRQVRGLTRAATELLDTLRQASYQHDVHRRLEDALKEGFRDSLAQPTPLNESEASDYLRQFDCRILWRAHCSDDRKRMSSIWLSRDSRIMARSLSWIDRGTPSEPRRTILQIGRRRFTGEVAERLALIHAHP